MSDGVYGLEEVELENTPIDTIESEAVNLIFVGVDQSGSMDEFVKQMIENFRDFKGALSNSKDAIENEMLVARANFNNGRTVIGGYKKIEEFEESYEATGNTPFYDTVVEGADKLTNDSKTGYLDFLNSNGMRTKAVFAMFTDGQDWGSKHSLSEAKAAIARLNKAEITTALIGFGPEARGIADALGFKNKLEVGQNTDKTVLASELRGAFNVLSKSVIESSKSVVANTQSNFFTM